MGDGVRWIVLDVTATAHGPEIQVAEFETEEEARRYIRSAVSNRATAILFRGEIVDPAK